MSLAAAVCAIATNASAGETIEPTWYRVNVHMSTKEGVPLQAALLWDSQATATEIFAKIGIDLTWKSGRSRRRTSCAGESSARDLAIEIVPHAPVGLNDGALAMAMPYGDSSVHILIFYARVA